jgi:polyphosphate kinase
MTTLRRRFSAEYKQEVLSQLHARSIPAAQLERELNLTRGTLSRWQKQYNMMTVETDAPSPVDLTPLTSTIDLTAPTYYTNRELSQIEFNRRVLEQSMDRRHPLLERAKFVAIFATNMDEFFMVRVSGLKQQVALGVNESPADGLTPREQLVAIHRLTTKLVQDEMDNWTAIENELLDADMQVRQYSELKVSRKRKLRQYFEQEIFPVLTPLAFDPSHPFPHISNLSINLAVVIRDPDTNETQFARVKVPPSLPRLVPLRRVAPEELVQPSSLKFVWLEQVIQANLDQLFPGMEIVDAYPFRVTRNNDMEIQEEEADDLLLSIEENVRQRHFGNVVRLEVDESMPDTIREILMHNFEIGSYDVYTVDGPLGLSSLWELLRVERPDLKDEIFFPRPPEPFRNMDSIFSVLRRQDVLLHRPYDNFNSVIDFLNRAAADPDVLAIKITLYRVGGNPAVVDALMRARANNKQVAALVELKARFDEESNINWARKLERAGVHVVYGVLGLKVHAKMLLIVRRERGGIRRYVHLATGNYNANTARVYEDLDFFTSDDAIGIDATDVFNFLTGYSKQREFRRFLVAPMTLRDKLMEGIATEAARGADGHIILKCNSVVDPIFIRSLYRASQAGAKVELIVRGICCLRPGIAGVSENITVRSVVGRFLEHSRIYYFANGGNPIVYAGSADPMPRNLDRRVEIVFPILDETLRRELYENFLQKQLTDTATAYEMQCDGTYRRLLDELDDEAIGFDSQMWMLNDRETLQQAKSAEV